MADTPSCALYAGLKSLGRINNGNAAQILMAGNARYGGRLISERLTVPSFISREIVHAKPGDLSEPLFAPFEQSARQILNLIMQNRGSDPQSLSKVAKRYMESCVPDMQDALTNCGVDGMLFRNGVERIETTDDSDIKDRLYIHLIFFIVTGCLGDPARAIEYTESFVSDQMLSTLGTVETTVTSFFSTTARPTGDVRLGLLRVVGNSARPPLRPLTTDPVGSIIGSLTGDGNAIIQAAKLGVNIDGSTLYCTHQPCILCAKMIVNAGIVRVVYHSGYPDEFALDIFKEAGVLVERYSESEE